jgi:hypothetical protein
MESNEILINGVRAPSPVLPKLPVLVIEIVFERAKNALPEILAESARYVERHYEMQETTDAKSIVSRHGIPDTRHAVNLQDRATALQMRAIAQAMRSVLSELRDPASDLCLKVVNGTRAQAIETLRGLINVSSTDSLRQSGIVPELVKPQKAAFQFGEGLRDNVRLEKIVRGRGTGGRPH